MGPRPRRPMREQILEYVRTGDFASASALWSGCDVVSIFPEVILRDERKGPLKKAKDDWGAPPAKGVSHEGEAVQSNSDTA